MIRALLLAAVLALGCSSNSFSQEKQAEKKKVEKNKPAAKKQAAPAQDWGRFNTGAKRDLEKMEKKDAKGKAKSP